MKFVYLLFVIAAFCSCYDEKDIVPTEGLEKMYVLPQGGNAEYDKEIVKWYEKHGFYTVYDFIPEDVYWADMNWDGFTGVPAASGSLEVTKGDPKYIGPLLEMFKEFFLDYYTDEQLACMPLKVFLCSELNSRGWDNGEPAEEVDRLWIWRGYDYFALNGASKEESENFTESDKTEFMRNINREFFKILLKCGKMPIPEEFTAVSRYVDYGQRPPYSDEYDKGGVNQTNPFAQGYLNMHTAEKVYPTATMKYRDFVFYLDLVMSYSWAELSEGEGQWDDDYNNMNQDYMNYRGLLNPDYGFERILQKYNIVVKYIEEELGVNLDRIRFPERFVDAE